MGLGVASRPPHSNHRDRRRSQRGGEQGAWGGTGGTWPEAAPEAHSASGLSLDSALEPINSLFDFS